MGRNLKKYMYATAIATTAVAIGVGCSSGGSDEVTSSKYLYISTGLCYSGQGFTAPNPTEVGYTLSRLNLSSLQYEIVKDYGNQSQENAQTFASGIVDGGDGYIYSSVENRSAGEEGTRRVDKIEKGQYGNQTVWKVNTGELAANPLYAIARASDKGVLVSVGSKIERYDATPNRKEVAADVAWVDSTTFAGSSCANHTARFSAVASLPNYTGASYGKLIYAHAKNGAGDNDIAIIGMNGYRAIGDCIAVASGGAVLTPSSTANTGYSNQLATTATPTAIQYIATPSGSTTGKLLVAYSDSTQNSSAAGGLHNALVLYDVNETSTTAATIGNGQILYSEDSYFFGVTSMAYDSSTGYLYAASSLSLSTTPKGYNVEKFLIDLNAPSATRVTTNNKVFQSANSFTKCVTGMFVGN